MSVQILVQGKLLGLDDFLTRDLNATDDAVVGRSLWAALICEIVPRALLAELSLARLLLGSSGGGQFLLVLPDAVRGQSEEFLTRAAAQIVRVSGGTLRLIWATTENLGDWTVVRKRLADELSRLEGAPLASGADFEPFAAETSAEDLFTPPYARGLQTAQRVGWSAEAPLVIPDGGNPSWPVTPHVSADGITIPRHAAWKEDESGPTSVAELASRATGRKMWGVLRGQVDLFGFRLRRLQSIEENVQTSMLYKQFFAGELEVLSAHGDFWRTTSVLYSGVDEFAIYGAWDALVLFANEIKQTFSRFTEENLTELPGAEAKTITMAIALATSGDEALAEVYEKAGRDLSIAQASDKDCIYLFDRVLEWKQLADAAELREAVSRVSEEFKAAGRQFLGDLTRLYVRASSAAVDTAADHERLVRRAYRFQRRYSRAVYSRREKEFQKLRAHLVGEIVGRNLKAPSGKLRLRPAGVVALEWARLAKEV